jgi:hypothetical protein
MENDNILYRVQFEHCAQDDQAENDASSRYQGTIVTIEGARETIAGRMEVRVINADAGEGSILDLLDCEAALAEQFSAGRAANPSRAIDRLVAIDPDFAKGRFLVIDRLEVLPAYRGWNLGLLAIDEAIEQLGEEARWTLLIPYPLSIESAEIPAEVIVPPNGLQLDFFESATPISWVDQLELDQFTPDVKTAVAALKRYYAQGGFTALPGTTVMVKHLLEVAQVERTLAEPVTLEMPSDDDSDIDEDFEVAA